MKKETQYNQRQFTTRRSHRMNICFVDARYCVCVEGGSQESLRAVWIGSGRGSGRHFLEKYYPMKQAYFCMREVPTDKNMWILNSLMIIEKNNRA